MVIQTGILKRRTPVVATTKLGSDIYGSDFNKQLGSSIATNSQGDMLALGAAGNNTFKHGEVLLMKWDGTAWVAHGSNYKINGASSEALGSFVDMNAQGDKIVIGAPLNPGGGTARGRAYVYFLSNNAWYLKLTVTGTSNQDRIGSVCMNATGDIVGVATTSGGLNSLGYIKIYNTADGGTTWTQLGSTIVGEAAGEKIGNYLKMNDNGDVIVISVGGNKIRSYYWDGASWIKRGSDVVGVAGTFMDGIPESLALNSDGNIMAFGCNNSGHGAIVTYSWDGTTWQKMGGPIVISINSSISTNLGFGTISLNAAGNILATYVSNNAWEPSRSRVYRWNGTRWESLINSIPPPVVGDGITSIDLNPAGNKLVIGVGYNSSFKTNAGLVRVYDISI